MSDLRPMKTNGDEARLLQAAVRERLSVASADLALPGRLRLSEVQRSTVSALLANLIRAVEDELRSTLSQAPVIKARHELHAAISSAHVAIAGPILERSSAHIDQLLLSTLVRRAEEHRRIRAGGAGEGALLLELIADEDPAVAELAMAVLIAQSRRYDGAGEPVAARTELPAELEHQLVWRVAAALRHYMIEQHGLAPAEADDSIVPAAEQLLADYDEGDSLEARAMRLARRLQETKRLSPALVERALDGGALSLFTAAMAVEARLAFASAWEILSDPRGRGPVLLLKAAGFARASAASILLRLGGSHEAVAAQADLFDVTDLSSARAALKLWQVNAGYRQAIMEVAA